MSPASIQDDVPEYRRSRRQSHGLPDQFIGVIGSGVHRLKAVIALLLALVWLPAVSCCLIDASGLFGKQECCSKEQTYPVSGPGACDKLCGALAVATYFSQQDHLGAVASLGLAWCENAALQIKPQERELAAPELPSTAPPELPGHWQFSYRTALSPRAPSFIS
jgi:hypothetical protein